MLLSLAQKNAWSLAKSLMVCITLFKADMGYGVMPSASSMAIRPPCFTSTTRGFDGVHRSRSRRTPIRTPADPLPGLY